MLCCLFGYCQPGQIFFLVFCFYVKSVSKGVFIFTLFVTANEKNVEYLLSTRYNVNKTDMAPILREGFDRGEVGNVVLFNTELHTSLFISKK